MIFLWLTGNIKRRQVVFFIVSWWMIRCYGYIELASNVFRLTTHTHYIVLSLDHEITLSQGLRKKKIFATVLSRIMSHDRVVFSVLFLVPLSHDWGLPSPTATSVYLWEKNEDLGFACSSCMPVPLQKTSVPLFSPISILPLILCNSCNVAEASLSSVNVQY
jgi:hypothetical protein